jgi:ATP-dependent Lhr-like helicase
MPTPDVPLAAPDPTGRRREILQEATAQFLARGYAGTSMSALAQACGVQKATLYHHFPSKEALFVACVTDGYDEAIAELRRVRDDARLADDERFRRAMDVVYRINLDSACGRMSPLVAEVSLRIPAVARAFHDEFIAPQHALLHDILDAAVARGAFADTNRARHRAPDLRPRGLAHPLARDVRVVRGRWTRCSPVDQVRSSHGALILALLQPRRAPRTRTNPAPPTAPTRPESASARERPRHDRRDRAFIDAVNGHASPFPAPFHPATRAWFAEALGAPTPTQARGWAAIAGGAHTLIAAPTGSGKTLAAFLAAIDALVRGAESGPLPDATRVVYVSPLKALGHDVERNLAAPLAGIAAAAAAARGGAAAPARITTAVRTGDTSTAARARMVRRPPHILVTTPEGLYALVTSKGGRRMLGGVRTVIVDEIHALAPDRRGAHLALTLERLDALVGADGGPPVQRIGLSATQKPVAEVAAFLVGPGRACTVIDEGHARPRDLRIEVPDVALAAVLSTEGWAVVYDRVAALVRAHRTTLVFVNSRRLCERVAHQLAQRLGADRVAAHHGSLAPALRLDVEARLKAGALQVLVATASLELGLDIGDVDLVVQLGSVKRIAMFLQRVGRANHRHGGVPKGRLIRSCARSSSRRSRCCAAWSAGSSTASRSPTTRSTCWPSRSWPRARWRRGRATPCSRSRAGRTRTARSGATTSTACSPCWPTASRPSGGAAASSSTSTACTAWSRRAAGRGSPPSPPAAPSRTRATTRSVSSPTAWWLARWRRTSPSTRCRARHPAREQQLARAPGGRGEVRVERAPGESPYMPVWFGELPARSAELTEAVSALRDAVACAASPEAAAAALAAEPWADRDAAEQLVAYLAATRTALGALPSLGTVVAERFLDQAGGAQVVVHAPVGVRVTRAWALALRHVLGARHGVEIQAAATDDGFLLSLPGTVAFPLGDLFALVTVASAERLTRDAALEAPMFMVRWRHAASRALLVPRVRGGRRVPPHLQRTDADELLLAALPPGTAGAVAARLRAPSPAPSPARAGGRRPFRRPLAARRAEAGRRAVRAAGCPRPAGCAAGRPDGHRPG